MWKVNVSAGKVSWLIGPHAWMWMSASRAHAVLMPSAPIHRAVMPVSANLASLVLLQRNSAKLPAKVSNVGCMPFVKRMDRKLTVSVRMVGPLTLEISLPAVWIWMNVIRSMVHLVSAVIKPSARTKKDPSHAHALQDIQEIQTWLALILTSVKSREHAE